MDARRSGELLAAPRVVAAHHGAADQAPRRLLRLLAAEDARPVRQSQEQVLRRERRSLSFSDCCRSCNTRPGMPWVAQTAAGMSLMGFHRAEVITLCGAQDVRVHS